MTRVKGALHLYHLSIPKLLVSPDSTRIRSQIFPCGVEAESERPLHAAAFLISVSPGDGIVHVLKSLVVHQAVDCTVGLKPSTSRLCAELREA